MKWVWRKFRLPRFRKDWDVDVIWWVDLVPRGLCFKKVSRGYSRVSWVLFADRAKRTTYGWETIRYRGRWITCRRELVLMGRA